MFTTKRNPSPDQEATSPQARPRWLRFGIAGLAALALLLLLLGSLTHPGRAAMVMAPGITKSSITSIVETNNTIGQAVAGEIVTVTVEFTVPSGETIYDASPRVLLADGLYPLGSNPAWSAMYTGNTAALRTYEALAARNGALVIFPTEGTVTGPATLTRVVRAVRTQRTYVGTPTEIAHNTNLRVQAVLRYNTASGGPAGTPINDDSTTAQVTAIQPLLTHAYTVAYQDAGGLGAGGGQVRLTFTAGNTSGRPTAYDLVYTATLGSGLTWSASSGGNGAGSGDVSSGPGGVTTIRWSVPVNLGASQTWQAVVTATLPSPFTIGREFTVQGTAAYETFDGDMPYEGKYMTAGSVTTLRPGVSITTKTSAPSSGAVTMGDTIAYTLTFQQAPNTQLQLPRYVDTLPRGFHYVSGTLTLQGATLISSTVQEGPSAGSGAATRYFENLRFHMQTLAPYTATRTITARYVALNTGLDYRGTPVWESATSIPAANNTIESATTGAMLYWTPPTGSTYGNLGGDYANLAKKANPPTTPSVNVIQPFMANTQFKSLRDGSSPVEIGDFVLLKFQMRNSGGAPGTPAHELRVCDTLPYGFEYVTTFSCTPVGGAPACPAYTTPTPGSTGTLCWEFAGLPRTDAAGKYYELSYQIQAAPATIPGVQTNYVVLESYSSKAGSVVGERNYADFPQALPAPTNCGVSCINLLGLAGNKIPWASHVAPGDLLTYTLKFTDTSVRYNYTSLLITDTYDSLLSFVSADPAPTAHDVAARRLRWSLGDMPINGSRQITLTMRLAPTIEGRYTLTNTMAWDSNETAPHTLSKVTPIDVAALHVSMSGPTTTYAGGAVAYTLVYSNTGSWNNAPVTLTLDYGPYLTYVSATPLTPVPGRNNVFVTTVPNNGVNKTLTIALTTNAPLPYTLEELHSSVELASAGAPSQTADWTITLQRPVFEFSKSGPTFAPYVGGTILYTFHVKNTGNLAATNLVITDTWDSATSFQSGVGWTSHGTYATYTIASLAPGTTATINDLSVKVQTQRDSYLNQASLRTTQTSRQETDLLIWSPSIELSKTAFPDPAFPGRVLTYTLTYNNIGGVTASNAVITDTLPDAFTHQGHTVNGSGCASPGWQFSITGQVATWRCTTLSANATGQLQIWGLVAADAEETVLENMAESDGDAPIPHRPMTAPLRTLVARPWLRVDKAGAPTHPVAPGDRITYTLTYENYGSYAANGVVIKDQLPAQVSFVGCSGGCTHNAGLVTWTIGEVPADTVGTVELYTVVKAGTGGQTAVNSTYTIENTTSWQKLLPSETENGAPVNTTILNPQLTVTKAAAPAIVQAINDTIVYTLTYQNTGGGFLHQVLLLDELDPHTAFLDASAGCGHSGEAAGGTVTCELGNLANGETRRAVIRVRVLTGLNPGDQITNQAQGDTAETALASSNTTTVWYKVAGAPVISVSPTALTYLVKVGTAAFNVPVTVKNEGQVPLDWTVTKDAAVTWLSAAPTGGRLNAGASVTVTVTFNPAGLAAGDHSTTLVFTSAGGNTVNVPVTLQVRAPQLTVAPSSFDYTVRIGATSFTASLHITNTGEVPVTWNLAENPAAAWLSQSATTDALEPGAGATVTLTFYPAGLAEATYNTTLRITGG
ncbi:MAG TPA: hypothetical protein PKV82_07715, partial [Anaerolineae bacterium]|nr:hypothetical protein [Anaerolineae bacterium]